MELSWLLHAQMVTFYLHTLLTGKFRLAPCYYSLITDDKKALQSLCIIFREYTWKNFACTQTGRKVISIKDLVTDQSDQLDYPDRVIQIALGFNHLIIATVKQCFIHKLSSWNTPVTFDLKEGTISMILASER